MPLPGADQAKESWPPPDARHYYSRYAEHSAWYDGSPLALAAFYGGYGGSQLGGQSLGFFNQNLTYPEPTDSAAPLWRRFMFWAKQPTTPATRIRMHVPAAADLATASADLLFSEEPAVTIREAHLPNAESDAKQAQDRLDTLIDSVGLFSTLIEAAEVCAALGGVFLRAGWDKGLGSFPILTVVHADAAVPEFRWGRLTAVTFWRIVYQDASRVLRHLERHEPGYVYHGLYLGDARRLGMRVPLSESPATADLQEDLVDGDTVETGLSDRLTAVYIPNMRPNRQDRGSSLGRSDFSGVESLMDSLDETWTGLLRDIRLGRARLIVPREYVRSEGKGKGADFDLDREVWTELEMPPAQGFGPSGPITQNQFTIRTQEHLATADALFAQIVAGAGYSGSTFGLHGEGTIKTATEIAAREQRSLVTRGKKAQYWMRPLTEILTTVLMLDRRLFDGPPVYEPLIVLSDSVRDDQKEIATTVGLLLTAQAASVDTRVRMVHSDWGDDQVDAEVQKILSEEALVRPQPVTPPGGGATPPAPNGSAPAGATPVVDDAGNPPAVTSTGAPPSSETASAQP